MIDMGDDGDVADILSAHRAPFYLLSLRVPGTRISIIADYRPHDRLRVILKAMIGDRSSLKNSFFQIILVPLFVLEAGCEMQKKGKNIVREYFELIAETAVFVFFVMTFVVQAFQIPTGSMIPKLLVGDFLLVNKMAYVRPSFSLEGMLLPQKQIKRKDIVVFKWPKDLTKDYVKRVIGLEGDKVEIRAKQLYINDGPIDEPYKIHKDSQAYSKDDAYNYDLAIRDNYGPVVVPAGHLFVMGDNRDDSADSRSWGFVPLANIKGRPWVIYFSYEAERDAWQKTNLRDRLKKILNFIPKARWGRILKIIN
jgi:signal peptidase I